MSSPADDQSIIGLPQLELGALAPRTLRSPRDLSIRDRSVERRLRQEAMDLVMPVYDLSRARAKRIKQRLDAAFLELNQPAKNSPDSEMPLNTLLDTKLSERFMRTLGVYFEAPKFMQIARAGFESDVKDAIVMLVQTIFEQPISDDKNLLALQVRPGVRVRYLAADGFVDEERTMTEYRDVLSIDEAKAKLDALAAAKLRHLNKTKKHAVVLVAKRLLHASLVANPLETQRRIRLAGQSIKPNMIQVNTGDVILRAQERVTERDRLILSALVQSYQGENRFMTPLGSAAMIVFLIIGLFAFHRSDSSRFLPRSRDLAFVTGVYIVSLMMFWIAYRWSLLAVESIDFISLSSFHFLVPVAFGVILTRIVLGFRAAAAILPLIAITAGWLMDMSLGYTIYALMGGLAGATMKTGSRPRRQIWLAGFWCGLWQAVSIVLLAIHEHALVFDRLQDVVAALLSGLLTSLFLVLAIPIIEALLGYTTSLRLAELASLNHSLLRDLLVQAPATYHHSIVVGAMAEAGAKRVGANPLLVKVAGYYHDVGKLKKPEIYLENQIMTQHTAPLTEEMATEIRSHLESSLALGHEYRLGHAVLEIIAQHHGNSAIAAYNMAAIDDSSLRPMRIDVFRHEGPKPLSKEAGLLMLADCAEAAVSHHAQSEEMNDALLNRLVHQVIAEIVASGQLDECALSLRDVYVIATEFVAVLQRSVQRINPAPAGFCTTT
jgi:putative nucleotidyltransferase with HDIG domain